MTRRLITLSDVETAPAIWAECDRYGWNGFHVPALTAQQFIDYFKAMQAEDRNGDWDVTPFVAGDESLHLPQIDCPEDRECDSIWQPEGEGAEPFYMLSGLVWTDADPEVAKVLN